MTEALRKADVGCEVKTTLTTVGGSLNLVTEPIEPQDATLIPVYREAGERNAVAGVLCVKGLMLRFLSLACEKGKFSTVTRIVGIAPDPQSPT